MAFCGRQFVTGSVPCAQFCYCFVVLILHTTKLWRGSYFVVVCDNDERTARRRSASEVVFRRRTLQARSQGVNQKLRNGFVDIAVPY